MKYLAIISHNLQELVETKNNVVPLHRQKEKEGSAQARTIRRQRELSTSTKLTTKIKQVC
jgi:hypothetical protein